jgi:hypothetical protein
MKLWREFAKHRLTAWLFIPIATIILGRSAAAESNSIGVTLTSDRDPDKFSDPKDLKYELNGSHTFDSGLIAGGSFQYNDHAFSNRASQNLEGTLGYSVPVSLGRPRGSKNR